jgi:hypothetical protein
MSMLKKTLELTLKKISQRCIEIQDLISGENEET